MQRKWNRALLGGLAFGLTLAAHAQPPMATVIDGHGGAHTFFVVLEVNGLAPADDAVRATRRASAGRGSDLLVQTVERTVPAGPTKLKLRASIVDAPALMAQTTTRWRSGDLAQIEGVADVDLKAGKRYRVNGVFDDFRREVWIEDDTGTQVGPPAASSLSAAQQQAIAGAPFLCCNQRHNGDWISDANWAHMPIVPAGSRVIVRSYGRHESDALVEGRQMRIGNEYGRGLEDQMALIRQLLVAEDPRPRIARMAAPVRTAIAYGRVLPGMTRDEVMIALGRPRRDLNATFDGPRWVYETYDAGNVTLNFGSDGKLINLDGEPKACEQLLLPASLNTR